MDACTLGMAQPRSPRAWHSHVPNAPSMGTRHGMACAALAVLCSMGTSTLGMACATLVVLCSMGTRTLGMSCAALAVPPGDLVPARGSRARPFTALECLALGLISSEPTSSSSRDRGSYLGVESTRFELAVPVVLVVFGNLGDARLPQFVFVRVCHSDVDVQSHGCVASYSFGANEFGPRPRGIVPVPVLSSKVWPTVPL